MGKGVWGGYNITPINKTATRGLSVKTPLYFEDKELQIQKIEMSRLLDNFNQIIVACKNEVSSIEEKNLKKALRKKIKKSLGRHQQTDIPERVQYNKNLLTKYIKKS